MSLINNIKMKEITLLIKIREPFFYPGHKATTSLAYMLRLAVCTNEINQSGYALAYRIKVRCYLDCIFQK